MKYGWATLALALAVATPTVAGQKPGPQSVWSCMIRSYEPSRPARARSTDAVILVASPRLKPAVAFHLVLRG